MPRLANIRARHIISFLEAEGFVFDHATGSHYIYYRERDKKRALLARHDKDIPKGTIKALLREIGYENDALFQFLGKK